MRLGTFAVAMLATASWSCSSDSSTNRREATATFAGWWIGTQTGTWDGIPTGPTTVAMEIAQDGTALLLGVSDV